MNSFGVKDWEIVADNLNKGNESRTERRHVENNHNECEKIHSHREGDPNVHCTNADQPNLSCLLVPNKNRISDFQQTNQDSRDGEKELPSYEDFRIDNIERRTDESAPYIRAIPPAVT
jgi:hypothetical protein